MKNQQMTAKLNLILTRDKRYKLDAYEFISKSIDHAREVGGKTGHLSGAELLAAFIDLSRRKYGNMARLVLESWGIYKASDVGDAVFNLVEAGILSKRPEDSREDFDIPTSFIALFDKFDLD